MIPYLAIAVYLLLTLWIGIIGYQQQQKTPDGYFLANRGLAPIVLFFTLIATNLSAFTFLGFASKSYGIGISYYPMMAFGTALIALSFYFIGYKVWLLGQEKGFITPSELIEDRLGSKPLGLLVLVVMVVFILPFLAVQPIGAGYLLETLTNEQIPYFAGATFLTLVIVGYVAIGGMKSVALTDVLQGMLMFTLMFVAVLTIAHSLGGITEANRTAYILEPQLFSRAGVNDFFTPKIWFSYIIFWTLSVPMLPQMFIRFYTAKTSNSLKTAAILYPWVTAILFICPVMIGVWGHINFPDLVDKDVDKILPKMLLEYTPVWISSLVMIGALAAFMSTLDSILLALSSILTRDIYVPFFSQNASLKEQTFVGRILIVILAIIGLIIAYNPPATILSIVTQSFTGLAVLFPTVITALYANYIHPWSCILSIVVGEAAVIGFQLGWIPQTLAFGFLPIVPIVTLCSLIIVLGGILNQFVRVNS